MLAIVLTCDRYRALTEHMIHCYARLWPGHPFRFRVPYQTVGGPESARVEFVHTPLSIKATVLTLLSDLDDELWVYWSIDDKYPIALDVERMASTLRWLSNGAHSSDVSGVLLCRCRNLLRAENLTGSEITDCRGHLLLERRAYHQIWIHQFLRVKVLRHLFQSFPDDIDPPKTMDALLVETAKPGAHRLFVARDNRAVFGESTSRGQITRNCYESMVAQGLTVPEWAAGNDLKEIIMGKMEQHSAQMLMESSESRHARR